MKRSHPARIWRNDVLEPPIIQRLVAATNLFRELALAWRRWRNFRAAISRPAPGA